MTRVAVLDDYQDVALRLADWQALPAEVDVHVFRDQLDDEDAVVGRLEGFDVVVAMRERTPFPRRLLERLPRLRLLVTTQNTHGGIFCHPRRSFSAGCGNTRLWMPGSGD